MLKTLATTITAIVFSCIASLAQAQGLYYEQSLSGFKEKVFEEINEARWTPRHCGNRFFKSADPLGYAFDAESAVSSHARDMASNDFVAFIGSNSSRPEERLKYSAGYLEMVSAIVFGGTANPSQVVKEWLDDPNTCAALMNPDAEAMAIARAQGQGGEHQAYWDVVFVRER